MYDRVRQGMPEGISIHPGARTESHFIVCAWPVPASSIGYFCCHKSDHPTTHYSALEINSLIEASGRIVSPRSRKNHALTIVRALAESTVLDFGGERGTRTLNLGRNDCHDCRRRPLRQFANRETRRRYRTHDRNGRSSPEARST